MAVPSRALAPLLSLLAACGGTRAEEPRFRGPTAEAIDGGLRVAESSLRFVDAAPFGGEQASALVRAPGRVRFRDGAFAEVGAPVDGRIVEVHVRLGEAVRRGQPLFAIASPTAAAMRAERVRSEVAVRAAETELARQRQMSERGVGVASELARADAELAEARALLAGLRASVGALGDGASALALVRSPIAGTVLARDATVGRSVELGGEPLVVVGEPDALWIEAGVFERDLPLVQVGAAARLELASFAAPIAARVVAVGGHVDEASRRAPVYLEVDALPAGATLRAGMYARATIEASGEAASAVPAQSVLVKEGGRTVVFVATGARTFVEREVRVGHPVDGRVPILAGLDPGERVVTRGALLLDGAAEILR